MQDFIDGHEILDAPDVGPDKTSKPDKFDEPPDPCTQRRRKEILRVRKEAKATQSITDRAKKLTVPDPKKKTTIKTTGDPPEDRKLINPKLAKTKDGPCKRERVLAEGRG
eukprot:5449892-Pyramimonas_sp.AAC.1